MNKFLLICVTLMLVFTSLALFATKDTMKALPVDSGEGKAAIGGEFTLTNQDGKTVTDKDFHGKDFLVFFGFTHCPAICPATMATITAAMAQLGEKADAFTPVFITVDPANDTPLQIKDYLSNFDSRIVGLTGTSEQLKQAASAYKVYYGEEEGMMNHSTLIYWMDENGNYIKHFPYDIPSDELAAELSKGL